MSGRKMYELCQDTALLHAASAKHAARVTTTSVLLFDAHILQRQAAGSCTLEAAGRDSIDRTVGVCVHRHQLYFHKAPGRPGDCFRAGDADAGTVYGSQPPGTRQWNGRLPRTDRCVARRLSEEHYQLHRAGRAADSPV